MDTGRGMVDTSPPRKKQKCEPSAGFGTLTKYDVFLNHRGPDLKSTFVSHLSKALRQAGRDPFLDAKSLRKGQPAFGSINEALSGVDVHIAIFSPRYAESKHCLNELCDMLASRKPVIPVFYDVEPENLCRTDIGPFAGAFHEHLKKGRDEDVVRWKRALLQAAAITGFKRADYNDTVKLEDKIVAEVLKALPPPPPFSNARQLVNLKESSKAVINMLHKMGDNVEVIGIWGMGGIGKTTLAKEVYNHEQSKYASRCLLSDVKEAKGVAVLELQRKIVADLVHVDVKKVEWDSAHWFDQIQKHKQRVLLVVDDICTKKQFDDLIPNLKELPPRSRVLITCRESDILKNIMLDIPEGVLFQVPQLSFADSLDLFVWCAFRKNNINSVDASFHCFINEIVRACCGLPLALEVMGGFLSDKRNLQDDKRYWEDATLALQKNGDIITSLQISYDGLVGEEDKRMFLDIACFMLGHPEEIAMEVWDSTGIYGSSRWSLRRLIDKGLVKVDGRGCLRMHDLLRDMGRNVVIQRASYKPEMQSHIWNNLVAAKVLQKKQGSDQVLALSVSGETSGTACRAEVYARMTELRYLLLDSCPVNGDFSNWSEELKWLQWKYFPHHELPASLELPNLAVLDLTNSKCLTRVWTRDLKLEISFKELRMLILSNCTKLRELPKHINKLVKLKFVDLDGCVSLNSLPDSLGHLTELEYLNLSECWSLEYLPDSTVELLELRKLLVSGCSRLMKLPKAIGRLRNLEVLSVSGTALGDLPESFGQLRKLRVLRLGRTMIKHLPQGFGQLQSLRIVSFEGCEHLQTLSADFGSLESLKTLDLDGCESLMELPESFSNLSNLHKLGFNGCKQFGRLPPAIGKLGKLEILFMRRTMIKHLPEGFGQLQNLRTFHLEDCKHLQTLSADFGSLESLQTLNLDGCERLMDLSCGFGQLHSLTRVYLKDCKHLQTLSVDFGSLESLETLDLDGCESLMELPESFSNLSNLHELGLNGCKQFGRLPPAIGKLGKLEILRMQRTMIKHLPEGFGQLQNLRTVHLEDCKHLHTLSADFGSLESLQTLNLDGCESLMELPESFSNLSNLEKLSLNGCKHLERLPPTIGKLKRLRIL